MDTDFPRMNTELNCAHAFREAGSVIAIRVYPWEIRVHPCSCHENKLAISTKAEGHDPYDF
jgi:hypothetical protein